MSLDAGDIAYALIVTVVSLMVIVASYRRSRHLSRYSVPKSVLIAVVAGAFASLWLVVWWVNRHRIADEWAMWRQEHSELGNVTA